MGFRCSLNNLPTNIADLKHAFTKSFRNMKSKRRLSQEPVSAGEKTDGGQFSMRLQGAALRGLRWPRFLLFLGLVVGVVGISAALVRPLTQDEADPFAIKGLIRASLHPFRAAFMRI